MPQAKGSNARIVIDYETTFGQDPAAPNGLKMPVNSSGLKGSRNLNAAQTITGTRNPVEPFEGNKSVGGQVVVPVDSIAFWYWLKAAFGAPDTTGTSPYTHKFTIGNSQPSLVIEQGYTDIGQYEKFNGCKIASLSFSVGGDGELLCTIDIAGADFSPLSATQYDSTPTDVGFSRLKNFQATMEEGGVSLASGAEVKIDINFGLDTGQYVIGGGGKLGDIPEGIVTVSGNLTALFTSNALLTKAVNSTESSLKATISAGASSALEIYVPELLYTPSSPGFSGPQGIRQTLDFQGYHADHADSSAVVITLTNNEEHP